MKERTGHRAWQMVVLGMLAAAMVVSLMVPESLLTPAAPERVEISILMGSSGAAGWSTVRQGMEQAAEDQNAELRFLTLEEGDDQMELLRRQARMDVDAAAVIPADSGELDQLMESWRELPVVTLESPAKNARAFIGPDDAAVGQMLAGQLAEDCAPGRRVLLVESAPNRTGPSRRLESAEKALEQAGFSPERCGEVTAAQLEQADAVVCFETDCLERVSALASQCGRPPLVYGAGVSDLVVARLETGQIRAIAAWSDYAAGYLAVSQAAAAARGQPVESRFLPVTLVQEGETYDKDHEKLLYPAFH